MSEVQDYPAQPVPPGADSRRAVEELVCTLPGVDVGQLGFDEPWQIRSFALAVAAHQAGTFDWPRFQGSLIGAISEWESGERAGGWAYYDHWVSALEEVCVGAGLVDSDALAERTREIAALPPNRNHHEAHLEPIAVDRAS